MLCYVNEYNHIFICHILNILCYANEYNQIFVCHVKYDSTFLILNALELSIHKQ